MNNRPWVYPFSFITFAPVVVAFLLGLVLVVPSVVVNVALGKIAALLHLAVLIGGGAGLLSALLLTFDIAGKPLSDTSVGLKRVGLAIGVTSELWLMHMATPAPEPFLFYWVPPLIGSVVLMGLSIRLDAKSTNR